MIVLDTNVISELIRDEPNPAVLGWADAIPGPSAATTSVTVAELLVGVRRLPDGRRKILLSDAIHQLLSIDLGGRILSFDFETAAHYASIAAAREACGRPITIPDAQIAAICRSADATLATRNVRDFEGTGVRLVNPWEHAQKFR